jgi:hypothetical protein
MPLSKIIAQRTLRESRPLYLTCEQSRQAVEVLPAVLGPFIACLRLSESGDVGANPTKQTHFVLAELIYQNHKSERCKNVYLSATYKSGRLETRLDKRLYSRTRVGGTFGQLHGERRAESLALRRRRPHNSPVTQDPSLGPASHTMLTTP